MVTDMRSKVSGFTLIELMITVAVLVILASIAAPAMQDFVRGQRLKTASFEIHSSLMYARSEAILRRASVSVTPVSSDWRNGWEVKSGATVLRSQGAVGGVVFSSAPGSVTYRMDGRLASGVDAFALEADANADTVGRRCVVIDPAGLPTTRRLTGSATCS